MDSNFGFGFGFRLRPLVWSPISAYTKHAQYCPNYRGAKLAWAESGAEAVDSKGAIEDFGPYFQLFVHTHNGIAACENISTV